MQRKVLVVISLDISVDFDAKLLPVNTCIAFVKYLKEWENIQAEFQLFTDFK